MIPVNYHNHTYLCNHATGTIDEYIQKAISQGTKEFGFSDHAPLPDEIREDITMSQSDVEFYISEILAKKDHYKDKIDIKLGFEVDYPLFDSFDKKYLTDKRIDYLIGSCHYIGDWAFDHPRYIDEFDKRDINEIYSDYYNQIENLINSNHFNIIGHFDIIKKFGFFPNKDFANTIQRISKLMGKKGITAEINSSGLLKPVKEQYPSWETVEIFFENNVPITIGSDSHSPSKVGYNLEEIIEKIKKIGYTKVSGFTKRKRHDISI